MPPLTERELSPQVGKGATQLTLADLYCHDLHVGHVGAVPGALPRTLDASVGGLAAACEASWRTGAEANGGTVALHITGSGATFTLQLTELSPGKPPAATITDSATTVNISSSKWACAPRKVGQKLCDDLLDWLSKEATPLHESGVLTQGGPGGSPGSLGLAIA